MANRKWWSAAFHELSEATFNRLTAADGGNPIGKRPAQTVEGLLAEVREELADIWGWTTLMWAKLQEIEECVKPVPTDDWREVIQDAVQRAGLLTKDPQKPCQNDASNVETTQMWEELLERLFPRSVPNAGQEPSCTTVKEE